MRYWHLNCISMWALFGCPPICRPKLLGFETKDISSELVDLEGLQILDMSHESNNSASELRSFSHAQVYFPAAWTYCPPQGTFLESPGYESNSWRKNIDFRFFSIQVLSIHELFGVCVRANSTHRHSLCMHAHNSCTLCHKPLSVLSPYLYAFRWSCEIFDLTHPSATWNCV